MEVGLQTIGSFLAFVLLYVVVGSVAAGSGTSEQGDYLLGGRSFGRHVVGLSAGAVGTSGFVMLGAVGIGYTMGVAGMLLPVAYFLGDFLFWKTFAARINEAARSLNCYTAPEFLSTRVKKEAKKWVRVLVAVITMTFVGIFAAAQLVAAGKTLAVPFDISTDLGVWITVAVVVAYCARGGLRSSMWVQTIQALMILLTVFVSCAAALVIVGGPIHLMEKIQATAPTLLSFDRGRGFWLALATLFGFGVAAFCGTLSAPHILVRVFSGKSPKEAAGAMWGYLLVAEGSWICMTAFGMVLRVLLPDIDDPEQGLPTFAFQYFDPWLVGAIAAGIFAAISSTIDGQLLVLSSAISEDMRSTFTERMEQRFGERYRTSVTILVAVVLALVAVNLEATVFSLVIFAFSSLAAAFSPAMLVVILGWRTSTTAIVCSIATGLITALIWHVLGLDEIILGAVPGACIALMTHWVIVRFDNAEEALGSE